MANPSATPASSAGTEILRRSFKVGLTNSPYKIIDGASTSYMYTLLCVTFCENAGAGETISMKIDTEASGNDVFLLDAQALKAKQTFVWNDKIMLWGTDELVVYTGDGADVDVYCTYIEQQFA
jgi:hypothetical protein